ncbi:MAG TPA: L,D-transpeptidase family protein [Verrucomicrobiota bacterium]|nr:L,D-transpeptidase family protein [Verrucomicrobiota bacterium]OQC67714.1 MAG: L,D-transpeptidase catalytic domain [Verrucomicrobia bacterium ADurb.Bin006]NMD19858.1 L,D-transpeptidase family protein [Verrucomicrobiota bacterium]HOA61323.1 L,D-transpeptidase family protein [Verrucomicrobiota bacterium]HOF47150.1 L,D-transpeptidase family protein [Verrucomicrobiota bacterium]
MKYSRATRLLRAAVTVLSLSLSASAAPRHAVEPPPDRLPARARQAIVVRPTRGFHTTLTAWERSANGWRRTAGPWPAVIGRNGFAPLGEKREGDGRTPSGVFRLGLAFGRPPALSTGLEYRQATDNDYWVDDPASPVYNRWVQGRPAGVSCEKMLLNNGLYDAGIVIEYNTAPIVPGRGSAIFIHVWDGDGQNATAGCVALDRARLMALLRRLDANANPVIVLGSAPDSPDPEWPADAQHPLGKSKADRAGRAAMPRFPLERGPLVLESQASPEQHFEALGEHAGVWGSLAHGVEGWAYPFKLFDGWTLCLAHDDGPLADLRPFASRHVATPHMAQTVYDGGDWRLTLTWFVPRSQPGMMLLLDLDGRRDLDLALRFRPVLAPMHLSATHPLDWSWDSARGEAVVREPGRQLELRVSSPTATAHRTDENGIHEIRFRLSHRQAERRHTPIAVALGCPARPGAPRVIDRLLSDGGGLYRESMRHSARVIERAPHVETPNAEVNDALRWSAISLDQLRVCNPYLGCGLVSGYSASGQGTRPKYCWFFEEPTLTACAYHWLGMSGHIREALRFLQRFQHASGKTAHEVVQSLPFWTNYFREFPYAYMHSDGPVYYLFAYGDYYRATGDLDFLRAEWPRIRRTLDWCFAAMDPADGLMRIEPGDWGSSESSVAVWKDTQLQGMWVRALRGLERLASALNEPDLAARCHAAAAQAGASIQAGLWDHTLGAYIWGLDRQGQPLKSLVPHQALSFWLGEFPPDRVRRALERMAGADFRTDWGVRSLVLSDSNYDPQHYQSGSVWPVWNAGVIVADYRHERGIEAYRTWLAMVRARTLDGLGPMPEVLDGRCFRRLDEGVPHQMFSELALVNGFFDGLLGLDVDVPSRRIELAPTLPPAWDTLRVTRIPCGPGVLSLGLKKDRHEFQLSLDLDWPGGATVVLAPHLPAGAKLWSVTLDGRPHACHIQESPAATRMRITLPHCAGKHTLRLRHADGIEWMPLDDPLTPGAVSRNLRVIRAGLEGQAWRMRVEGLPGRSYPVDLFTDRDAVSTGASTRIDRQKHGWRVTWTAPSSATTNAAGFVEGEISAALPARAR